MPDIREEVPEAAEYVALRQVCGLTTGAVSDAVPGLRASLHAITVREGERLIGMGRIIGDGATFAQVTDIAVHPDWQRQGIAREVMTRLMAWCDESLPTGCFLSLIADPPADKLYEQFGFEYLVGMGRHIA
ncbi:MAG: GNAT family N-acetyltransferase [Pseudomonadota bacterium]